MAFNPHISAQAAAPESAYNTANNQLAINLERLDDLVANLRHRLTPVLGHESDKAVAAGEQLCKAAPAPLVATLEHHAARADRISDEVNDLLQRLCL